MSFIGIISWIGAHLFTVVWSIQSSWSWLPGRYEHIRDSRTHHDPNAVPVSEVSLCLCSVSCDVQCGRRLSFSTQPNCPVFLPEHTLSIWYSWLGDFTHTHTHTHQWHTRARFFKIYFLLLPLNLKCATQVQQFSALALSPHKWGKQKLPWRFSFFLIVL